MRLTLLSSAVGHRSTVTPSTPSETRAAGTVQPRLDGPDRRLQERGGILLGHSLQIAEHQDRPLLGLHRGENGSHVAR